MAEEKQPKNASAKGTKVFDVAPPKSTAAPNTSRPVIVGHTNMIQKDPMVSSTPTKQVADQVIEDGEPEQTEKILDRPKREVVLQPSSDSLPVKKQDREVAEESTDVEESASEPQQNSEPKEDDADESGEAPKKDGENAAVDALVNEVSVKREREKLEEEQIKRDSEIAELAASKKYYVKIQTPASKRNFRALIVLLVLAILAAVGWFFGMGPGVEMWNKDVTVQPATTQETAKTDTSANASSQQTTAAPKNSTFSNATLGLAFSYPTDWKVETVKDTEFATRDVVTLTSPAETIKIMGADGKTATDAEVFLRTRIFVENTTNNKEYASDLLKMSSCSSEDIVVASQTMKLLFVDLGKASPNISQVSLSPSNCVAAGALFNADDQVQFSGKKNTYILYAEYVFSEAQLKKAGTSTPDAIKVAQESGVIASKENFKAGKNYQKLVELIKTLREEQKP